MVWDALTDGDVDDIQAAAAEFRPDTCDIVRLTEQQDAGGTTIVETVIASDVRCHYSEQLTPQDVALAERHDINIDARLLLPADQDITASDRMTITLRGTVLGTYEVSYVVRESFEGQRLVFVTGPI